MQKGIKFRIYPNREQELKTFMTELKKARGEFP